MSDDLATGSALAICQWCSAELPAKPVERCPSCGAALGNDAEAPGLTSVDSAAIARAATPRRGSLMSWITGEADYDTDAPAAPEAVAPPPPEVRREMLRMELEAEVAELVAEAGSLAAEAREAGVEEDGAALEEVVDEAEALREDVEADGSDEVETPTEVVTSSESPAQGADEASPTR